MILDKLPMEKEGCMPRKDLQEMFSGERELVEFREYGVLEDFECLWQNGEYSSAEEIIIDMHAELENRKMEYEEDYEQNHTDWE